MECLCHPKIDKPSELSVISGSYSQKVDRMRIRRIMICMLVGLGAANSLGAQTANLIETPTADQCIRNELTMTLEGKIQVKQDDKDLAFPHKAQANHAFTERYLDIKAGRAVKAARYYTAADSTITFNNDSSSKRTLRPERRFIVTQRVKDQLASFSPNGALTRDEMELTEHFDTMAITAMLPGKAVEVGKSWPIANGVVLALCELDGVTSHSLEGTLDSVKGNIALCKITGKANGINLGAEVEMNINARFEFDIKLQRVVSLEWTEADKRQQGPITPALTATVTIKLTRSVVDEPEQLNKFAMVKVPRADTPPTELTNIIHQDAKKRFELSYAREWHVTSPDDSPQLVMRHLERGEFVAQATFTMWKKIDPKEVTTLDKFAEEMSKTPGWVEDKELERKQLKDIAKGHHTVYRVAASGELDRTRTVQYFYLIVSPQGDQLIVTFSVVPQHAERLGARDLEVIREIAFP
jgi:hypothetical protein